MSSDLRLVSGGEIFLSWVEVEFFGVTTWNERRGQNFDSYSMEYVMEYL